MKIVAVTCGRRHGNTEILVKSSLMGVKEIAPDAEIEIVRLQDISIKYCTGCELCMRSNIAGGDALCVQKGDDFDWLVTKFVEADGIIMGAPIYDCLPPAIFIAMLNRGIGIGREKREAMVAKQRSGAVIAVGGSDWTNLALPVMEFTLRHYAGQAVKLVERVLADWNNAKSMVLLDDALLERCKEAGRRVAKSVMGEEVAMNPGGICPACGCTLLEPRKGEGINAACPICDTTGRAYIEDGELRFNANEESILVSRIMPQGGINHRRDVNIGHTKADKGKEIIEARLTEFKQFDPMVKPRR